MLLKTYIIFFYNHLLYGFENLINKTTFKSQTFKKSHLSLKDRKDFINCFLCVTTLCIS